MKESEQKALADQALADFAAREGIALESTAQTADTGTQAPVKSMRAATPQAQKES